MSENNTGLNEEEPKGFTLSNQMYDALRFLAVIMLPALGSAYFALAGLWSLPKPDEVVGTIVIIDTLLGVVVRTARRSYENSPDRFDGVITVSPDEDPDRSNLRVQLDPAAVADKDEVRVRVKKEY